MVSKEFVGGNGGVISLSVTLNMVSPKSADAGTTAVESISPDQRIE